MKKKTFSLKVIQEYLQAYRWEVLYSKIMNYINLKKLLLMMCLKIRCHENVCDYYQISDLMTFKQINNLLQYDDQFVTLKILNNILLDKIGYI